ncbi:insulin-degrading enzyme-like 1, peroxisomal isoform X1 [Gossypium arboreum]|uniref:insulin-degrading enzyme-like 1, peroxisomal isoform X1 n=1 Tax=Gossypium arboreum TaxID=29729 RepID=UPI0008197463|nr:insulin-degrading enzyme-like 1, peroxisomal isoform X1 [Gossypium arboreum]
MAVSIEDVEILKPKTDKREYRRIVLKNSLQVLLISDPDTDKCAASLNVGVGSFCDPVGLEGLAHFLEHMLFYASEKYPLEDSYLKYITEHGGSTNAFTASEMTNYFFDANTDCFEEALDRFAQFFIKPLMSADATMREIKAVDSENKMYLLSDERRMSQLQKHLSLESHPYHKFGGGNCDTLDVRPKAKGVDTRQELLKFYEDKYSANLMHLVVYSKESLDKIQSLVEDKFQEIQNSDRSRFQFSSQPCTSEHLQILVRAVPIKQGHKLRIVWPITPSIVHYKEEPCRYLDHLINHEGEGSLSYVLKKLGWATELYAGEDDRASEFSFFYVVIDLTDAGQDHMQEIIGLLFKYIQLLQQSGVCKWIFDELSAICETGFHYEDKISPIDYVVRISSNMQIYPPKDWLVGSSLPSDFNPDTIQKILNELSPESVRIFWESNKFEGLTDKVEPWYGTAYSIEKVSPSRIQAWMSSAPNENLHLPVPNVFIPTDLSIKNPQEKIKLPVLLRKSSYSKLWYKPDTVFSTPKAYVKIDFDCPYVSNSPETEALANLLATLLMDDLNEYAYYAQVAGLHYDISHTESGFQVTLVGYNHKLRILLETIVNKIAKFEVRPDRFSVIKEMAIKAYQNFKFQQPYEQANDYYSLIIEDQTWPWMEQLEVLHCLDEEDLAKFAPIMLSRAFLQCYIAGNIEHEEAVSMIEHIEDVFFKGSNPICQPLFPSQILRNRVVKLGKGMNYCYSKEGLNPSDENSALIHYIQVHRDDFILNVKLQLVALIGEQAAFHQLRSVEQLGYITYLGQRNDFGIHGLLFIIQSTVKDPGHIDSRVEAFLRMFESKLSEMKNDEFKGNVNALINMKLEKHKSLSEESQFYWTEIISGTPKFDRREAEVEALKKLTQQELIDFFDETIKVGATRKKTLSVRVYGNQHLAEYNSQKSEAVQPNTVQVDDIFSFRRSRPLYASFR